MTRIRLALSAEQDLLDGQRFCEQQQPGVGDYFLDALLADIDSLQLFAGVHTKLIGRLHRSLSKRFPFAIYYDFDGETATVIAVLDCRQDPASIKERLA